nr:hypothetical protein [Chitinophagaceae bacterium]
NLRDAIALAFEKPLYSRTSTTITDNQPFTSTLYYTDPNEDKYSAALFRQCIFYKGGKYYLSFEIRGKKDPE